MQSPSWFIGEREYRLGERIAAGGIGEIHRATGPREEHAALKFLLPPLRNDPRFLELIRADALLAAKLSHPAIPRILHISAPDSPTFYLGLELISGANLRDFITRARETKTAIPIPIALAITKPVLEALAFAHEIRPEGSTALLVHHAVSPRHVMVSTTGQIKLLGWDSSRAEVHLHATRPAFARGRVDYWSPEQLTDGVAIDRRADVFSVSIMLYEMVAGRHPFGSVADVSRLEAIVHKDPTPPAAVNPGIPSELSALIMRGLQKPSNTRFGTATAMKDALEIVSRQRFETATPTVVGAFLRGLFKLPPEESADSETKTVIQEPPARKAPTIPPIIPPASVPAISPASVPAISPASVPTMDIAGKTPFRPAPSLTDQPSVSIQSSAQGTIVILGGTIDEAFRHREILEQIPKDGPLVFDFDNVHRMTSYGVREWTSVLKGLPNSYYCFVRCRPAIMTQFNIVTGFGGEGTLVSFYAPYVCGNCGKSFDILTDLRHQRGSAASLTPPPAACPDCKEAAEFDDLPDVYFSFVSASLPISVPHQAETLIDAASGSVQLTLRVRKEVQGTVTAIWLAGGMNDTTRLKRLADGLEGNVLVEMSGVVSNTEAGVAQLGTFLTRAGVPVCLARVPSTLAIALARRTVDLGHGFVGSARVPARCSKCGWKGDVDVDAPLSWANAGKPANRLCHQCFASPLVPAASRELLSAFASLPQNAPPEEVREYLASHLHGPSSVAGGPASTDERSGEAAVAGSFGRYNILGRLGSGGMAEVFLATKLGPEGFEKQVALKRILPHLATEKALVEMFLREARIAARLSHPNIVQIFDFGIVGRQYFIAMEYVRGWDLNSLLGHCAKIRAEIPVHVVCRLFIDICAGLHAAHAWVDETGCVLPIIHRDVSPHNVLVSTSGITKVTDFGIAKAQDSVSLTSTGEVRGKTSYMAPERLQPTQSPPDHRADIFSVGAMMYECLSLQTLFRRETKLGTIRAILGESVPRLSERRQDVSSELETIIDRAIARDAERRFQAAADLQLALEDHVTGLRLPSNSSHVAAWLRALGARGLELPNAAKAPSADRPGPSMDGYPPAGTQRSDA